MSKKLQLQEPCHENRDQMKPEEKGRFCASCRLRLIYKKMNLQFTERLLIR